MYEHSINIEQAFVNGLAPNDKERRNSPFCAKLRNLRPTARGAVQAHQVILPETLTAGEWAADAADFPFPQWFKGQYVNVLGKKSSITIESDGVQAHTIPRSYLFTEHLKNGDFQQTSTSSGVDYPTHWLPFPFEEGWWTHSEGSITHIPGNSQPVNQIEQSMEHDYPLAKNMYYRISITVTGMTTGSLTCTLGDPVQSFTLTENKTHEWHYLQGEEPITSGLKIVPSLDFDGTVNKVKLFGHAPTTIPEGGPWQFASFQESYFMTNGECLAWSMSANSERENSPGYRLKINPTYYPKALGQDETRLWFGDMQGDWFETERGQKVFQQWRLFAPQHIYRTDPAIINEDRPIIRGNFIFYTEQMGRSADMPHFLGMAAFGFLGNELFDQVEPFIMQAIEEGQIGMIPLAYSGNILAIKQLGTRLLAYGDQGVSALWPVQGMWQEQHYCRVGIAGRMAVNGYDQLQAFLDRDNALWLVVNEQAPQYIGYNYLFPDASNMVISFDTQENEWWITNGTTCYVLTQNGLGGPVDIHPTNLIRHPMFGLAGFADGQDAASLTIETESDLIDIAERGTKHITTLQCFTRSLLSGKTAIKYRYEKNATMKTSAKKPLNREGVSFPRVSFSDAQVLLEGTGAQDDPVLIEKIEVRYNNEDRRYRRGTKGIPEET